MALSIRQISVSCHGNGLFAGNNDMIQQMNIHGLQSLHQRLCGRVIFLGGKWRAGGMIVRQNNRTCVTGYRNLDDPSGGEGNRVFAALLKGLTLQHLVFPIQTDQIGLFLCFAMK